MKRKKKISIALLQMENIKRNWVAEVQRLLDGGSASRTANFSGNLRFSF
jgi:hypothetical protein